MRSNKVICPHCNHVFTDEDMERAREDLWAIAPEEGDTEETCPSCEKLFFIKGTYKPVYETFATEEAYDYAC